jgi:hypothetical protein
MLPEGLLFDGTHIPFGEKEMIAKQHSSVDYGLFWQIVL